MFAASATRHNMVILQVAFQFFSSRRRTVYHPLHNDIKSGELGQGNRGRAVEIGNHVADIAGATRFYRAVISGISAQSVRW